MYFVKQLGNTIEHVITRREYHGARGGTKPIKPELQTTASSPSRLDASISRTCRKVYELAVCNPWQYFVTFTLDETKANRTNVDDNVARFAQWVRNERRYHGHDVRYLLLPEYHADGSAVHFHGLLAGVPDELTERVKAKRKTYLNLAYWYKNMGFSLLEPVKNPDAVAKYVTKYITKEVALCVPQGAHALYASQGLKRAELLGAPMRDTDEHYNEAVARFDALPVPEYANDYVRKKTVLVPSAPTWCGATADEWAELYESATIIDE